MYKQITILGPGLLGASLAMAIKDRMPESRLVVWSRRAENRTKSLQSNWCDATFDRPEDAVVDSDLVVVCTPVESIVPLLERIEKNLGATTLVTDVGSTKNQICQAASKILVKGATFVGSHPMAGSELKGMDNAKADLFENAACILTPTTSDVYEASNSLRTFWQAIGMHVTEMAPDKHDEVVAHISHLPHLLASTLCSYLAHQAPAIGELSGSGLRDTTRVAAGDPDLWQQILHQNSEAILRAVEGYEVALKAFKATLKQSDSDNTKRLLQLGKEYRDSLNK